MSVAGKAKDITVVGFGSSELEDVLKPIATAQGRTLHGETSVQSGFYFRSDHFNFAKAGVPALYADGGEDLVEGGIEAGKKAAEDYAKHYHSPSDQYYPETWKLDGTVQDLEALYGVGKDIALYAELHGWCLLGVARDGHPVTRRTRAGAGNRSWGSPSPGRGGSGCGSAIGSMTGIVVVVGAVDPVDDS